MSIAEMIVKVSIQAVLLIAVEGGIPKWKQAGGTRRYASGVEKLELPPPAKKQKTGLEGDVSAPFRTAFFPETVDQGLSAEFLSVPVYRNRLVDQGKYKDTKPGSHSVDNCLQDPPVLPPSAEIFAKREPEPKQDKDGTLLFPDHPEFRPNLTPEQVLRAGAFGGTYFRNIKSAVTGISYTGNDLVKEFPASWFRGLNLEEFVTSSVYKPMANKYGVSCGGSLGQWETSGWISSIDPYGWFQWYCRFYLGRRSSDDERQIDRWLKGEGPKGRWRLQLMNKVIKEDTTYDDVKTSPVIRQTLLHWAYQLTEKDLQAYRQGKRYVRHGTEKEFAKLFAHGTHGITSLLTVTLLGLSVGSGVTMAVLAGHLVSHRTGATPGHRQLIRNLGKGWSLL